MNDSEAIAVIGGQGLGDNLIEMVIANNAVLAGYRATMFSTILSGMTEWFPKVRILESLQPDRFDTDLVDYARIFWPNLPAGHVTNQAILCRWVEYEPMYQKGNSQVENMVSISRQVLRLSKPVADNGIQAPAGLAWRRHPKRVCIHPTSAEVSKNWLPQRFVQLGKRLKRAGFEVCFIMSASEQAAWAPVIEKAFPLYGFPSVGECAAFTYESGFFIGNDSGGGHLASCLQIPTLSIHGRRAKARLWKPGWGKVEVITPRVNLIGSYLRQHYWKYFLSVTTVERRFHALVRNMTQKQGVHEVQGGRSIADS